MTQNPAFITIEPTDPRHKQILTTAIKNRDVDALNALRGNMHKPIRYVTQWFLYSMMTHEFDESEFVVIYSPEVRQNLDRAEHTITRPDEHYTTTRLTIPTDLYDFLL